jgi:hypothetical protein
MYSIIAGTKKMVVTKPALQAFLANDVFTGIKLAIAPIDDPPIIDMTRSRLPIK